jgi:hypothetical protein
MVYHLVMAALTRTVHDQCSMLSLVFIRWQHVYCFVIVLKVVVRSVAPCFHVRLRDRLSVKGPKPLSLSGDELAAHFNCSILFESL